MYVMKNYFRALWVPSKTSLAFKYASQTRKFQAARGRNGKLNHQKPEGHSQQKAKNERQNNPVSVAKRGAKKKKTTTFAFPDQAQSTKIIT